MWYVYLLYSPKLNRTYIGATTDPERRLRQHNREIKGGARSTQKGAGTWEFKFVLSGFNTKSEAYRWEKILKLRGGRGLIQRSSAFDDVSRGNCPIRRKKDKHYPVPSTIKIYAYEGMFG
jgi:predicted GIY-YIG superfamily endonuclease